MNVRRPAPGALCLLVAYAVGCVDPGTVGTLDQKPRVLASVTPSPASSASPRPSSNLAGGLSNGGLEQGGATASATPTAPPLVPEVRSIELSTTSVILKLQPFNDSGDPIGMREHQIIGVVRYSDDRSSDRLTWRSTDASIVTVTDGLIRAVSPLGPPPGLATASVIATALDAPTVTATCEVSVNP